MRRERWLTGGGVAPGSGCGWGVRVFGLVLGVAVLPGSLLAQGNGVDVDPLWAVEDRAARAALPEYRLIPALPWDEASEAADWPTPDDYRTWRRSNGDPGGSRYASLRQIDRGNVGRLEVAWVYRSGDGPGNLQCNPVVVDGVLVAPTAGDAMVGLEAGSGREIWRFRDWGGVGLGGRPAYRGLNSWDPGGGEPVRVLFCAGGFLYALEAATGRPVESFGERGRVPVGLVTSVGGIFEEVLVIPGFERDVFGLDVRTGRRLWTFRTIPEGDDAGAETWAGASVRTGANVWGGMVMDVARGLAIVATGSPKPNFSGATHPGRNLYANSVVALDARTGRRRWHFQEIRHDIWDLDIPAPPNLVTVTLGGRRVDAVAQVTKLGNTLLLDRETGRPLHPFRLRRAPVSVLPGERTWPYQPDVELPEPFARQEFTLDDVTDRTPEARAAVLRMLEGADFGWFQTFKNGRPLVFYGIHGGAEWTGACFDPEEELLFVSSNEIPWIITVTSEDRPPADEESLPPTPGRRVYRQWCVACHGPNREGVGSNPSLEALAERTDPAGVRLLLASGRNGMPPFPQLSDGERAVLLDYLFERDGFLPDAASGGERGERPRYRFSGYPKLLDPDGYPGNRPPWGTLNAIDLPTGRIRWRVPLGEYPELVAAGVGVTGTENFGGPLVTAGGLVFCSGTRDGLIRAFDRDTGAELWRHPLPFAGSAPPMTYEWEGVQYVVIAATGGGKLGGPVGDAWVAFSLKPDIP